MKVIVLIFSLFLGLAAVNATPPRMQIKTSDLPKSVRKNIAWDHQGWTTVVAFRDFIKGITSYEVVIKKGAKKVRLYYNKNGKYEKMETINDTHRNMTPKVTTSTNKNIKSKKGTDSKKIMKN